LFEIRDTQHINPNEKGPGGVLARANANAVNFDIAERWTTEMIDSDTQMFRGSPGVLFFMFDGYVNKVCLICLCVTSRNIIIFYVIARNWSCIGFGSL